MSQTKLKTGKSLTTPSPESAAGKKPSKLSRLKPLPILPPGTTIEDIDDALRIASKEASAAWERQRV